MFNVRAAFEDIARGDSGAFALLSALYLFVQKQDDLIDRDKQVETSHSVGLDLQILREFSKNLFFQKHQDFLWPLLVTSGLAYIASEDIRRSDDVLERITAQVLKSQYLDVFLGVAYCIGGFDHALTMSRKYREYAFDDEGAGKQL